MSTRGSSCTQSIVAAVYDLMYQEPTPEEVAAVKAKKKERKVFRDEINEKKAKMSAERKELKDKCIEAAM